MINKSEIRKKLLDMRQALEKDQIEALNNQITINIKNQFIYVKGMTFGCYWSYMGEYDFSNMMHYFYSNGADLGLPAISGKKLPLKFKRWQPDTVMEAGIFNIPIPVGHDYIRPDVLFVPLVGYDKNGFRLGYGGGYYDITLGELKPKPITVGIGYEMSQLDSICPKEYDIAMDFIVTEKRISYFDDNKCVEILKKNEVSTLINCLITKRSSKH